MPENIVKLIGGFERGQKKSFYYHMTGGHVGWEDSSNMVQLCLLGTTSRGLIGRCVLSSFASCLRFKLVPIGRYD